MKKKLTKKAKLILVNIVIAVIIFLYSILYFDVTCAIKYSCSF